MVVGMGVQTRAKALTQASLAQANAKTPPPEWPTIDMGWVLNTFLTNSSIKRGHPAKSRPGQSVETGPTPGRSKE